ncbi:hypothetical protein AS850_14880 [Frondihabitans sp. 762G35]|nr:hypothetical protein AS850_14880 [Frondihabitans sp. 762G35]
MTPDANALPDDGLDGHTMDELADYLDRGRTPYDASIEGSAACRLALSGMTRLSELTADALANQATRDPARDEPWIARLLEAIRDEIRPGRDVPISHPDPALRLTLTEAAVRGLVRRTGDATGGVIVGRCSLDGEVATPGEVVRVDVTCAIEFGLPLDATVDLLRDRIREALVQHTELVVGDIDITVDDIYPRRDHHHD